MTVRARRWLLVGAVLFLVAGVAGGVLWVGRDRSAAVPATVVLAAASDPGSDPFVPVAANQRATVVLPPAGTGGAVTASVDPDSGVRLVAGTTDRLYAGASGDSQELYGGSGSLSACDPAAISEFLAAHPDKASAWAGARGIDPAGIADYLHTLTPVILLHDTVVTNHGFASGVAVPLVSVLQAGTAVLVDVTGLPVVRCACGNPLSAPPTVDLSTAVLQGTGWDGYDPGTAIVVTAGVAVSRLVVVDAETGQDLTVNVGQSPAAPSSPPITTQIPTTTSVDAGLCALDLTWPATSPGWIEPLDPSFTCQEMIDQWRRNEQWPGERGGTMFVVDFGDGWYCTGVHWDPTRPRTNAVGSCDLGGRRFNVYQGAPGVRTTVPTDASTTPAAISSEAEISSVAGVVVTATGSPTGYQALMTPSRNIRCYLYSGYFACTEDQYEFALPETCENGSHVPVLHMETTGPAGLSSCRSDDFAAVHQWPDPTPYGSTAQVGDISCDVEETGLTCTNLDGHGFTLSRAANTVF